MALLSLGCGVVSAIKPRTLQRSAKHDEDQVIALTTQDPDKTAAFYKEALGSKRSGVARMELVFLTDGYINLAILNWKTEKDADVGPNGPNYSGIHHLALKWMIWQRHLRISKKFRGNASLRRTDSTPPWPHAAHATLR